MRSSKMTRKLQIGAIEYKDAFLVPQMSIIIDAEYDGMWFSSYSQFGIEVYSDSFEGSSMNMFRSCGKSMQKRMIPSCQKTH